MIAILERRTPRERRQTKCWKKARRRIQYASSYLAMATAKETWMTKDERNMVIEDVEEILSEALKYVRLGKRMESIH